MTYRKRPRSEEDLIIDMSWDHFALSTDAPNITVHVCDNQYDESSIKELKRHARWMLRVAEGLEYIHNKKYGKTKTNKKKKEIVCL